MAQEHLDWLRGHLHELYQTPILESFLNLRIVELSEGKVVFQSDIADRHSNIYGFIHGGTFASICDTAMGVACVTYAKRIVTIDLNVSYIRNIPAEGIITATGIVVSNGKTIMRASGEVYSADGQLLVQSHASYFVTGPLTEDKQGKKE